VVAELQPNVCYGSHIGFFGHAVFTKLCDGCATLKENSEHMLHDKTNYFWPYFHNINKINSTPLVSGIRFQEE